MTEERIRFAQHVYNEIMAGHYGSHDARAPSKTSPGYISGSGWTLLCEYKWFGRKRETTLQRIEREDCVSFAYHAIRLTSEEEDLLWSVWPKVSEMISNYRQLKLEERLKRAEELQWWP